MNSLLMAFAMYSRIPVPRVEFEKGSMKYSMCFFPAVGAVIGGCLWLWYQVGRKFGISGLIFTVLAVLLPILITGGIHMDGFMDTVDARSSFGSREKKLRIMKDPHAGAFAVLGCVCYMLLALGIWDAVQMDMVPVLAIGFVLSRTLSAFAVIWFPGTGNGGTAAAFSEAADKRKTSIILGIWGILCAAGMLSIDLVYGGACLVGASAAFLYYRIRIVGEFGGVTGDLAGYFLQICELLMAGCVIAAELLAT